MNCKWRIGSRACGYQIRFRTQLCENLGFSYGSKRLCAIDGGRTGQPKRGGGDLRPQRALQEVCQRRPGRPETSRVGCGKRCRLPYRKEKRTSITSPARPDRLHRSREAWKKRERRHRGLGATRSLPTASGVGGDGGEPALLPEKPNDAKRIRGMIRQISRTFFFFFF